ncbi:MAG TPA: hypothetical protein VLA49_16660 [Anaerolineales bacterium]|nr:hypothetical protein [Anaerolineales bacterium]
MKSIPIFSFILTGVLLLSAGSALAGAETFHDSGRIPIDETLWNDCTGEYVHVTGTILWTNHGVVTSTDILHWGFQNTYQGVSGIGETSGIKYQVTKGGEHGYGTAVADPDRPYHYAAGSNYTLHMVAQGKAPNLVIRAQGHVTVTPNFHFVTHIDPWELVCR